MAYTLLLKRSAERELERLSLVLHDRIVTHLIHLKDDPRPTGVKKLQAREGYRLRVGDYRILYTIDDSARTIEVFSIAHRRDVYR